MKLNVLNIAGEDTGKKVELTDSIFAVEPNDHAIYLDVKQYMANNRQGTHSTKDRSQITGSTRKIRRQKGTGSARVGSIKNPLFRGGGIVSGPVPRSYRFKLNKKTKQLARKSALSYKAKSKSIKVLEDFKFDVPKTKEYINLVNSLKINDDKTLIVLNKPDKNIYLSSRNIKNSKVVPVSEMTTYDIMNCSVLIFVESSLDILQKMYKI